MSALIRWLVDKAEISVVATSSLDERPVTLELKDASVDDILSAVARRYSVKITHVGSIYFMGESRPEDKAVLVRRVFRLDSATAISVVHTLLSTDGQVQCTSDGLLIVGDQVEVIIRIVEMLDKVEQAPLDSWFCQIHVVTLSDDDSHNIGIDLNPSLDLSASLSAASGAGATWTATASATLNDIIHTAKSSTKSSVDSQPFFVCLDGVKASQSDTTTIPVPTQTTSGGSGSAAGTTQTSSFQNVDIGFKCEVLVHYLGNERATLSVDLNMSHLLGYVNNTAPISQGQEFSTQASVQSGGVYLLGELTNNSHSSTWNNLGDTRHQAGHSRSITQIWAKVFRISAPILEDKK